MKNSSKLLGLGLVLFLGACSAAEGDFLKKVEGKTASNVATDNQPASVIGKFSTDGKTFSQGEATMTFSEATDENTGLYTGTMEGETFGYTFKTTDGATGTFFQTGFEAESKSDITLK